MLVLSPRWNERSLLVHNRSIRVMERSLTFNNLHGCCGLLPGNGHIIAKICEKFICTPTIQKLLIRPCNSTAFNEDSNSVIIYPVLGNQACCWQYYSTDRKSYSLATLKKMWCFERLSSTSFSSEKNTYLVTLLFLCLIFIPVSHNAQPQNFARKQEKR